MRLIALTVVLALGALACGDSASNPSGPGGAGGATSGGGSATGGQGGSGGATACPEELPPDCPVATPGARQAVASPTAGAYFLRHPPEATPQTDVVVFLPGGPGNESTATITWDNWLGGGDGIDDFLVAMPYADDGDLTDEYARATDVLDELERCFCQSGRAHLGGTSNGGVGAFNLMLTSSGRFVTLLGAPGLFQPFDASAVAAALDGKAIFNGAGETDTGWLADVESTHESLLGLGVDSTLTVFPGEGHILSPGFDETVFFDWWSSN